MTRIPDQNVQNDINELLESGKRYLLAFSGGPDSVFLLEQLADHYQKTLKDFISLVYVNYHDSPFVPLEESIVYDYVKKYDLKIHRTDTQFHKEESGNRNFEEWARDFRYAYFESLCQEEGYEGVLTAHQKSDVIETYLIQKNRKNFPSYYGLRKVSYLRTLKVIRPMLSVTKDDLIDCLNQNQIPFYDDITNKDPHKQRTSLRLQKLSEEESLSLEREMKLANERIESINQRIRQMTSPYSFPDYEAFDTETKRRFLFSLLDGSKLGIEEKRRESLANEMDFFLRKKENGVLHLTEEKCLYKTKEIFFIHSDFSTIKYSFTYAEKKKYENEFFAIDLSDPSLFNLKELPVTIRNYQKGDIIDTEITHKDVAEFLKKEKVPFYLRDCYPVFVVDGRIKAVPFYEDLEKLPLDLKFEKL